MSDNVELLDYLCELVYDDDGTGISRINSEGEFPLSFFASLNDEEILTLFVSCMRSKQVHNFEFILEQLRSARQVSPIIAFDYTDIEEMLYILGQKTTNEKELIVAKQMLKLFLENVQINNIENFIWPFPHNELNEFYIYENPALLSNPTFVIKSLYNSLREIRYIEARSLYPRCIIPYYIDYIILILSNQQIPYNELVAYISEIDLEGVYCIPKQEFIQFIERNKEVIDSATHDIKQDVDQFLNESNLANLMQDFYSVGVIK
jgi:hypothetical protein